MKKLSLLVALAFVAASFTGCDMLKKKAEQQAQEAIEKAVEEAVAPTPPEPAEPVAAQEPAKAEEPATAVPKEDIEKAAKIYALMHDEALEPKDKKAKFDETLEEFGWDEESYKKMVYDISEDVPSRNYYNELNAK